MSRRPSAMCRAAVMMLAISFLAPASMAETFDAPSVEGKVAASPTGSAPIQKQAANPAAVKEPPAADAESAFSIEGGVDVTTAYFFRGYRLEDRGLIVQPYGTISFQWIDNDAITVSPYLGTWNSLHSETRDADDWQCWYETDVIAGASLSRGPFTLDLSYNLYTSPNGSFRETHELGAILSYDDEELLRKLWSGCPTGLNPHVALYREIHDRNGTEDTYLEIGIEPQFPLAETPLTLSLPAIVGTSVDGFYADEDSDPFFGYASIGLKLAYQLTEHWSVNVAATYLRLEAAAVVEANGGDRDVVIGTVGLGFAY